MDTIKAPDQKEKKKNIESCVADSENTDHKKEVG